MNWSFGELNFVELTLSKLFSGKLVCVYKVLLHYWLSIASFLENFPQGLWWGECTPASYHQIPLLSYWSSPSLSFFSYLIIMLFCSLPFSSFPPLYYSTRYPLPCDLVHLFSLPPLPATACSTLPTFNHVYCFSDPTFFSSQKKMLARAD